MLPILLSTVMLLGLLWAAEAQPAQDPEPESRTGESLYLELCATCHGETGDGRGTTELDRPARSFLLGGFSFGNTPEAIFRTISNGIGGTPMPSFGDALSEEQRWALTDHILELAPELLVVDAEDTVLAVADRPQVVRGGLPPIVEGAALVPRGLLVGGLDGMSWEYRADDVRLLGVRQGEFVRRRDWQGRGGDTLEPLGRLLYTFADGAPEGAFALGDSRDRLRSRLRATRVLDGVATVVQGLESGAGGHGTLAETGSAATLAGLSGFTRVFTWTPTGGPDLLRMRIHEGAVSELRDSLRPGEGESAWLVHARPDGLFELIGVAVEGEVAHVAQFESASGRAELDLAIQYDAREARRFRVTRLLATEWNAEIRARLEEAAP